MSDLITIVNENDEVIGSALRKDAQEKGLWHRIVVVLVFNNQDKVFIQKRSVKADTSPGLWDHSAAGHVDSGESSQEAAKRELYEELGIKTDHLTDIAYYKTQLIKDKKILNRFWYIYSVIFDGNIRLQRNEVSDGKFVEMNWLKQDLNLHPDSYTDGIKSSFSAYLKSQKSNIDTY